MFWVDCILVYGTWFGHRSGIKKRMGLSWELFNLVKWQNFYKTWLGGSSWGENKKDRTFWQKEKKLFYLIIAQGKWKSHESVWDAARQKCGFKCVGIAEKIYTTSTLDGHRIVVVVCTAGCYSFFCFMFQYLSETWQWLHRAWRNPGSSLAWGSAFAVPWVFLKKEKRGKDGSFWVDFFP